MNACAWTATVGDRRLLLLLPSRESRVVLSCAIVSHAILHDTRNTSSDPPIMPFIHASVSV